MKNYNLIKLGNQVFMPLSSILHLLKQWLKMEMLEWVGGRHLGPQILLNAVCAGQISKFEVNWRKVR